MVDRSAAVAERQLTWYPGLPAQPLGENEIHLWTVDVHELQGTGGYRVLQESDLVRSRRIRDPDKRQLYLGGRAGLRLGLSHYTGIDCFALEFGYGQRGKPVLANELGQGILHFNYTLSSGRALYSVAWNRELGVDLELLPRKVNFTSMARRKLADDEQRVFNSIAPEQKNDAMLACWTRKEAYGKVLGVGIRYHMNRVPLFRDLHLDKWSTCVAGLFAGENPNRAERIAGVQLGLPVPGVAALMYHEKNSDGENGPRLFACQL